MKKLSKQIMVILMCLCLLTTMIPTNVLAVVGDYQHNTYEENQDLLTQLAAFRGGSDAEALALLDRLGLLDEEGRLNISQSIDLDGELLSLDQVMALLQEPGVDLGRIATVDGTPISLGDLKTMVEIETELQRIQDTYFSGQTFSGEAAANLNSLLRQFEADGSVTVRNMALGSGTATNPHDARLSASTTSVSKVIELTGGFWDFVKSTG